MENRIWIKEFELNRANMYYALSKLNGDRESSLFWAAMSNTIEGSSFGSMAGAVMQYLHDEPMCEENPAIVMLARREMIRFAALLASNPAIDVDGPYAQIGDIPTADEYKIRPEMWGA